MNEHQVNWTELAQSMGAFEETYGTLTEQSSSDTAAELVCELLGRDFCLSAVDHYVSAKPGMETARSVLQLLKPFVAMERCNQIIEQSEREDERESAMELLRSFADKRAVPWLPNYLSDSHPGVRVWAIYMISELLPSAIEPSAAESFIGMLSHEKTESVETAIDQLREEIRKYSAIR